MPSYCPNCEKNVDVKHDQADGRDICSVCGYALASMASSLRPGMKVAGFEIGDKIGQGGMGVVYKAKQVNLQRHVALKVLSDELSSDSEFVERFFKEARAAASLNHPNIVQVYDAGTHEDLYFFAMELIEGETLENKLDRDGPMKPADAMAVASKIASALQYAWARQKLCHGDIKPENIMLEVGGSVKLADLGLAKSAHDESSFSDGIMATPLYAPPELISGDKEDIDQRSDIYSFGATMYHMLAGTPPFPGEDPDKVLEMHLHKPPPSLAEAIPELNPLVAEFIEKLLSKLPDERPESWKEVKRSIDKMHNFERKVFHRTYNQQPDMPDEEPVSSGISPYMKIGIAAIVTLIVVIGVLISAVLNSPPEDEYQSIGENRGSDVITKKWERLKNEVPLLDSETAIKRLKAFVRQYQNKCPAEVGQLLEEQKNRLEQERVERERMLAEAEAYSKETLSLLEDLSVIDTETAPLKELKDLKNIINDHLELARSNEHFHLQEEQEKILTNTSLVISSRISVIEREIERKRIEEIARLESERLEKEKKRRAEQMRARQQLIAINKTVDDYYLILAGYVDPENGTRSISAMRTELRQLLDDAMHIPANHKFLMEFLLETVIASAPRLPHVLIAHKNAFIGKELPAQICPAQLAGYSIDDVDEKGFKMMQSDAGVKIGSRYHWNDMGTDSIMKIIGGMLLSEKYAAMNSISREDANSILSFSLLKNKAETADMLDKLSRFSGLGKNEKAAWRTLIVDFKAAPEERKHIKLWRGICEMLEQREELIAYGYFPALYISSKASLFRKRYASEFAHMLDDGRWRSPLLMSLDILDKAGAYIEKKDYIQAMHSLSTAGSRCAPQTSSSEDYRNEFARLEKNTLDILLAQRRKEVEKGSRVPFYYWEDEKPGDAWVYYRIVEEKGFVKKAGLSYAMELAALLDTGNWHESSKLLQEGKASPAVSLAAVRGKLRVWTPSFCFAQGLIQCAKSNNPACRDTLSALKTISSGFATDSPEQATMKAMSTALTMEYSLMNYMFTGACDIGMNYPFTSKPGLRRYEMKIALLYYLALMKNADRKELKNLLNLIRKNSADDPKFKPDIDQLELSFALHSNGGVRGNKLEKVLGETPYHKDICARIMLEAVAKSDDREAAAKIIEYSEKAVSGNLASSVLYTKKALAELSSCISPLQMKTVVRKLLADHRMCTTPLYGRLIMLNFFLEARNNKINLENAGDAARRFIEASSVASAEDLAMIDAAVSAPNPKDAVNSFVLKGLPGNAVWTAAYIMLVHPDRKAASKPVFEIIRNNRRFLSESERKFIEAVRRISAAN